MTHTSTEQERAEFEAWVRETQKPERGWWCRQLPDGGYSAGNVDAAWLSWQAARRAQAVPQGWQDLAKRCLAAMETAVHFRKTGEGRPPEQTCLFEIEELRAALAAAPQPPEAAPVELPEPVYTMRVRGRMHDYTPTLSAFDLADGEHELYTGQQVRQLLADQQFKLHDLAMLTRKLVQSLRKAAPDNVSAEKALDYLKRKGLGGNPLRSTQEQST